MWMTCPVVSILRYTAGTLCAAGCRRVSDHPAVARTIRAGMVRSAVRLVDLKAGRGVSFMGFFAVLSTSIPTYQQMP